MNWKIVSLLIVTLLVALGLQAGAIKIMIDLAGRSDAPVVADSGSRSGKPSPSVAEPKLPAEPPPAPVSEERVALEPAPPAREPQPTVLVADPPHLADLPTKPDPAPSEATPEVQRPAAVTPPSAPNAPNAPTTTAAPVETAPQSNAGNQTAGAVTPSAEAALAEPAAPSDLQESVWLKARDPKHFTVQVYSGKSLNKLREVAAEIAAAEPQAFFSTGSSASPWYSLIVGDYPDAAAAQAAAAKLTARSPALKPWVRRFDEIQVKMR